jgi:glycosyltransferase involved in cell wall biosynthesis
MQVTVIIPTFKRIEYLQRAIASVREQTYQDFSCLIVNDYPPDSVLLADAIASLADPRFQLINHETSLGGNAARNTGILAGTGEIIAFLDDDDYWLPEKLQKHLACHQQNPQAGLVFSGVIKQWNNDVLPSKTFKGRLPEGNVRKAMSQGKFCPRTTSGVTVRRECFELCGLFDGNLVSFQDWDMWYRIAHHYDFACIDEALLIFRQHLGDRTSQSRERRLQGLNQLISKWQTDFDNVEEFKTIFLKDTYVSSVYHSILRSQTKTALQDWYTLLKLSRQPSDILVLLKLILMLAVQAKNYSLISRFSTFPTP